MAPIAVSGKPSAAKINPAVGIQENLNSEYFIGGSDRPCFMPNSVIERTLRSVYYFFIRFYHDSLALLRGHMRDIWLEHRGTPANQLRRHKYCCIWGSVCR